MNDNIIFAEKESASNRLKMENMCKVNDYYWFTSFHINALFKLKTDSNVAEYVGEFPDEISKKRMYSTILEKDGKLYCIPLTADSIGIYDIEKNLFSSIKINVPKVTRNIIYDRDSKFFTGYISENYLYLLPHTYPAVVRVDLEKYEIEYFYEQICCIDAEYEQKGFFISSIAIANGKKWCYSNASKKLYSFDDNTMRFIECKGFHCEGIGVLAGDGENLWFYDLHENQIYKYEPKTKKFTKIKKCVDGFIPGSFPMTRSIYYNNYIYFVPGTANVPLKIDVENEKIEIAKELLPYKLKTENGAELWKFCLLKVFDDELVAFDTTNDCLVQMRKGHICRHRIALNSMEGSISDKLNEAQNQKVNDLDSFIKTIVKA